MSPEFIAVARERLANATPEDLANMARVKAALMEDACTGTGAASAVLSEMPNV